MLLYHGSNIEIMKIDLEKCKPYKDFGRGFYLTTIESQAIQMAKRTVKTTSCGNPYVTAFEVDNNLSRNNGLSMKIFDLPSAEWAVFVINNRNRRFADVGDENCNQDNKYDVVVGPVADDDIAFLFRTFTSGLIDADTLVQGMRYRKLNDQYSFHTDRAISCLTKVGAKIYE